MLGALIIIGSHIEIDFLHTQKTHQIRDGVFGNLRLAGVYAKLREKMRKKRGMKDR